MELASATLTGFRGFPLRCPTATSREYLPSISSVIYPSRRLPSLGSSSTGYNLLINPVRLQRSSLAAVGGDTMTIPNDCNEEHMSSFDASDPSSHGDLTKNNDNRARQDDIKALDGHKMTRTCDKLIDVFMVDKPNTTDWRKLLAFSKAWNNIRPHFYKRCQDRADSEEDPGMKHKLLRLRRKLKEVDEDVQRHNELIALIKRAPSEIGEIVARRRKDFTREFFVHLHTLAESYYENPTEREAVAKLGDTCLAAVQAYDTASESIEALQIADLKFQDLINSPSVDAACRKIDYLAENNQLDPALMLMITKAWAGAKETNMVKDEAKDILYHLYMTARGNLQRLIPKEVRILKYLLMIKDPEEKLCALNDAFTPGEELEGQDVDCLYTTPEELHAVIKSVVDAFHFGRGGTVVKEARDLVNPKLIKSLEELQKLVENKFM